MRSSRGKTGFPFSDRAPQRETKQRQRVGAAAYFYWRVIICQTAYTSTPPKQAIGSLKLL
jgi:hypothetical protein